jgi:hypothetical protein
MKRRLEERMVEFEISLINQIDFEIQPLTLLEIAGRRWGSARVIEGKEAAE